MDKLLRSLFCICVSIFIFLGETDWVLAYSEAWQLSGPYGANVTALNAFGGTVFAGTEQGHLYKSTTQGSLWARVTGLPTEYQDDEYVTTMVSSGTEMMVVVGKQNNPYSDRVRAFYRYDGTNFILDSQLVFNWAEDPEAQLVPKQIVASGNKGEFLAVGKDATKLKHLQANGSISTVAPNIGEITAILNQGGVFWLITATGQVYQSPTPLVATSWQTVGQLPAEVLRVDNLLFDGTSLWVEASVTGGKRLYSSIDGRLWSAEQFIADGTSHLFISDNYLCFGERFSQDSGQTWQVWDKTVNTLCKQGAIVLLGTPTGIFRSTDAGSNFTVSSDYLTALGSFELLHGEGLAPGELLVASEAGVFRSTDWGITWLPVITEATASIAMVDDNTLLRSDASTEGVYRYTSTDGRATFTKVDKVFPYGGKLFHDAATGTTYLGGWNGIGYPLKVSQDGGQSWATLNTGLAPNINVYQIKKDPAGRINLATSDGLYQWNGTAFVNLTQQQFFTYHVYDVSYVDGNTAYAIVYKTGFGYKIVKTSDNGVAWQEVTPSSIVPTTEVNERNFYCIYADSAQVVYVGTFSGGKIYKTANGGSNWVRDAVFTDKPVITSLEKIGNGHLYATTSVGVWDPPILFDAIPPVLDLKVSQLDEGVELSAALNEPGRIYYELSNQGEPPTPQPWLSPSLNGTLVIETPGRWYVKVWAEDDAGNPSQLIEREIQVATGLPSVEVDFGSGNYNTDLTVTFRSSDPQGKLYYTASFEGEPELPTIADQRLDDGTGIGIHYIPYHSGEPACTYVLKVLPVDRFGQVGAVQTFEYTFDSSPPVITVSAKGGVFLEPLELDVALNEEGYIRYQWNEEVTENSPVLTEPLTISESGRLQLLAKDLFGNESKAYYDYYIQGRQFELRPLPLAEIGTGIQLVGRDILYLDEADVAVSVYGYNLDTSQRSYVLSLDKDYNDLRLARDYVAYSTSSGLYVQSTKDQNQGYYWEGTISSFDVTDMEIGYLDEQQVKLTVYGLKSSCQQIVALEPTNFGRKLLRIQPDLIAFVEGTETGERIVVRQRFSGQEAIIPVNTTVDTLELTDEYVVWSAGGDVFCFAWQTKSQFAVTGDGQELRDKAADVYGNTIVWKREGQLYCTELSEPEQASTTNRGSGSRKVSSINIESVVSQPVETQFVRTYSKQFRQTLWSQWANVKRPQWLKVLNYFV